MRYGCIYIFIVAQAPPLTNDKRLTTNTMKQLYIEKAREMRSRRWVISRWNLRPGDEIEKWPVLASRAPEPESWMLTGRGSVGVIRRKPGGSAVGFIANLSLERGGIFEYGFLDGSCRCRHPRPSGCFSECFRRARSSCGKQ
jgi:hypothetical protein